MANLRSLLFWLAFGLVTLAFLALLPLALAPRALARGCVRAWAGVILWLARHVAGLRTEIRGSLPDGAFLIAAKHQSMWETLALQRLVEDPVFILKRELLAVPVLGLVLRKLGAQGVNRAGDLAQAADAFRAAKAAYRQGRSVVIFPEGTRRPPGSSPAYDAGVHGLYRAMGAACLPVAVHSGHVWPPGSWRIRPGTAFLHFLTPLPPGLARDEFMARLATMIEEYSAKS